MRAGETVEMKEAPAGTLHRGRDEGGQEAAVGTSIGEGLASRGKKVPDEMIEQVLEAGRAAPTGCNLDVVRFIVVKDREKAKMIWSDIPTPMDPVRHHRYLSRHESLRDGGDMTSWCPITWASMQPRPGDHMCLMAHALGLGAVWLSCTEKTAKTFQQKFGLPDYIKQDLHIAVGWTAIGVHQVTQDASQRDAAVGRCLLVGEIEGEHLTKPYGRKG